MIVDCLTKVAHFVPVKTKTDAEKLANLYVEHILRLHGAPSSIVSDRGPQFVSQFWEAVAEPPKKSGPRAPIDVSTDLR